MKFVITFLAHILSGKMFKALSPDDQASYLTSWATFKVKFNEQFPNGKEIALTTTVMSIGTQEKEGVLTPVVRVGVEKSNDYNATSLTLSEKTAQILAESLGFSSARMMVLFANANMGAFQLKRTIHLVDAGDTYTSSDGSTGVYKNYGANNVPGTNDTLVFTAKGSKAAETLAATRLQMAMAEEEKAMARAMAAPKVPTPVPVPVGGDHDDDNDVI